MERLSFQLPDFTRVSWVSERARGVWEPRIKKVAEAWLDIQWLSVAAGLRDCCRINAPVQFYADRAERWAGRGLEVIPLGIDLPVNPSTQGPGSASNHLRDVTVRLLVGRKQSVEDFCHAATPQDHRERAAILGYPSCCIRLVANVVHKQGFIDTTWHMAGAASSVEQATTKIEVAGQFETNIFWRRLGVRAIPHLPCSFDCRPSRELGRSLLDLGREAGYAEEVEWLREILSWPCEWSALHGIAELKTPLLRVMNCTDATAVKYVVKCNGAGYPSEAGSGLSFPYVAPQRPLLTLSRGFRHGIEAPIQGSS